MTLIQEQLEKKACLKQDVYGITKELFDLLWNVVQEIQGELSGLITNQDSRVEIVSKRPGVTEVELWFGGDLLVFHMHTNVFAFPQSHPVHKHTYVSSTPENGYVGAINIYNFLADSYRYNRMNDSGYLVGRIFVNRDRHFFMEGERQLGFLYNDFANAILDAAQIRKVIESAVLYALDFELLMPPFNHVKEVTVSDLVQLSQVQRLKTGKRLGFRFQGDNDAVEF